MISSKLTLPVRLPQKLISDSSASLFDQFTISASFFSMLSPPSYKPWAHLPLQLSKYFIFSSWGADLSRRLHRHTFPHAFSIKSEKLKSPPFLRAVQHSIMFFTGSVLFSLPSKTASVLQMKLPRILNTDTGFPIYLVYLYNMSQLNLHRANLHSWDSLLWVFQFPYRVLIPDYDCFL